MRAASRSPHAVRDACEAAVSARWPRAEAIRFAPAAALPPSDGDDAHRYVSQFETLRGGRRGDFACEARPSGDGGWTVSRLSVVSR